MKIAVTGKGGTGKTTVVSVLAKLFSEEGKKVGRIHVVSITEVLAKAIHRTFNNDSVSSLFL